MGSRGDSHIVARNFWRLINASDCRATPASIGGRRWNFPCLGCFGNCERGCIDSNSAIADQAGRTSR